MNPSNAQTSMQVYASDNDQYKSSPTEDQIRAGVVPLDTLPAAWWNYYWSMVTSNNNASKLAIDNIRAEIINVLTAAGIEPTDAQTNQLRNSIISIHRRTPFTDESTLDQIPGSVISSSDVKSVSVNSDTGKMTVNAMVDWTSGSTIKEHLDEWETEQEEKIDDALDTIDARAHVIALNVINKGSTSSALILKAESRVDGGSLDSYEPKAGDMIVLVCPTAVKELENRVSLTLSIGDSQLTYTDSDGIQLGNSNVFTVVTFASASGTMVMTSGSGGLKPLRYVKHIQTQRTPSATVESGGVTITLSGHTPCVGDVVQILYAISTYEILKAEFVYGIDGWLTREAQYLHPSLSQTQVGTVSNYLWVLPLLPTWVAYPMSKSVFYLGQCTNEKLGAQVYTYEATVSIYSSRDVSSVTCTRSGMDGITEDDLPASAKHMYCAHSFICKVGTAFRLNNELTSTTDLCYADAAGNLHAHTLELT